MENKLKMFMKILTATKKCLILVIIWQSKHYDDSNKLVIEKMKDEIGSVAIGKFVGLKPKMCSFLVDDKSEHKKQKS